MNHQDKTILELVVTNAVLSAFEQHRKEVIDPLEDRLTKVETDMSFVRRSAKGAWAVVLIILSYFGFSQ